jgi:hypothetical protein
MLRETRNTAYRNGFAVIYCKKEDFIFQNVKSHISDSGILPGSLEALI